MILLIDNYDSFSYNLYQLIGKINPDIRVIRNDEYCVSEIERMKPEYIIISPGPKAPAQAGVSMEVIEKLGKQIPILGICLGHQAICQVFGASYHSLAALPETMPKCLKVTAKTEDGEIMAVEHEKYPIYGMQFHPESILTPEGENILKNFFTNVR